MKDKEEPTHVSDEDVPFLSNSNSVLSSEEVDKHLLTKKKSHTKTSNKDGNF